MKLGVQLFTVRREAQKDLEKTLIDLSAVGIKNIEAARIPFDQTTAEIFNKAKDTVGTQVIATQIKFCKLKDEFDKIVKFHKTVGCKSAIISVLPTEYILGEDKMLEDFAKNANELAVRYLEQDIQLCYHHHDFEFVKTGKSLRYDIITENMKGVKFILDTYWLTKSGISTVKVIEKLGDKIEGLHLRDYSLTHKLRRIPKDFAVGEGVIDFDEIIQAAKAKGVNYGAIEQNTKKPFVQLGLSVENLKKLGYCDLFN